VQRPRREGSDTTARARSLFSGQVVDVIVLTADPALLAILREAAGLEHVIHHAASIEATVDLLVGGRCGILILDMPLVRGDIAGLVDKLQLQFPDSVLLATGRRDEQSGIAQLITSGRLYRFLHKPVSPARAELFLSAATRRYSELHHPDVRGGGATQSSASSSLRTAVLGTLAAALMLGGAWLYLQRTTGPIPETSAPAASTVNDTQSPAPLSQADAAQRAATVEREFAAALAANNTATAVAALRTLQQIAPTHPNLDAFRAQLLALSRKQAQPARLPANSSAPARTQPSTAARTPHIDLAKEFLAANQLIEPPGANVLDSLRLAREAGDGAGAQQRVASVLVARLADRALEALQSSDFARAWAWHEAAASIDREFAISLPQLDSVADRILTAQQQARNAALRDQLARAMTLRTSGQLLEPPGDNAVEIVKRLVAEHPDLQEVRTEQQQLSFTLLEHTRTALAANDIDGADVLASRAEEIQPGLPQTKGLREQIGAQRLRRNEESATLQAVNLPRRREIAAVYPRDALVNGTEGWVDLAFTISLDGAPTNVTATAAQPVRVFDAAAISALRQWRFEPIVRDGVPQTRRATLRMEFKLKQ